MGDTADALPIGGGVVGGALSAAGALQQNRAVKSSYSSLGRAYTAEKEQTNSAAALEATKLSRTHDQVLGRLRVREADSGAAGGSFAALETGAAIDAAINQNINETNRVNQQKFLASQYVANATRILSQKTNVPLAVVQGVLQGAGTGLQIQGDLGAIDAANAARKVQEDTALAYITSIPPI
jgi:hypothetical protein